MAFFGVTIETLSDVRPHPNADRLELASLKGSTYQFVIGKDSFKVGDQVLYFPIDAELPDALTEKMGLTGKLQGKTNRVRTVKLRGQYSQGLVGSTSIIAELLITNPNPTTEVITEFLGVRKYEPEVMMTSNANLVKIPIPVYDIEGIDRYPEVVAAFMDIPVQITEKIEGTNAAYTLTRSGEFSVCQRRFSVEQKEGSPHTFWGLAEELKMKERLQSLLNEVFPSAERVTIRGEITGPGIQGNYYRLKKPEFFAFDISTEQQETYVDAAMFNQLMGTHFFGVKRVPVLVEGKTLREVAVDNAALVVYADGMSVLATDRLREGVVIKPMVELPHIQNFGRPILKKRSLKYLEKTGN